MNIPRTVSGFLAGLVTTVLLLSASSSEAVWTRTVDGHACWVQNDTGIYPMGHWVRCPFVSDTTMSGNSATQIFADAWIGDPLNLTVQACARGYNGTSGSCGTPLSYSNIPVNHYDFNVPKWVGTGSQYDYFWVEFVGSSDDIFPTGIAVVGN